MSTRTKEGVALADHSPFGKLECWQWKDGLVEYVFYCPGCKCHHTYVTAKPEIGPNSHYPVWGFNNPDRPTFTPSLLYRTRAEQGDRVCNQGDQQCHIFLTDGQIQFLSDCTHELAGKTIPLEEFHK